MRTTITFIALWFGICNPGLAQNDIFDPLAWLPQVSVPATNAMSDYVSAPESRRILPEEIVQDSVQLIRFSANSFAVRWTYTEAGAKKILAFQESHVGQKTSFVVGSYESPPGESMFRPMPAFTNYAQWKEGWLKHRTDKVVGVNEEDAKRIVSGLKIK